MELCGIVAGKDSFFWLGPKPTVLIMNHDLIKEVTLKYVTYEKPHSNPLTRLLAQGIVSLEGDKWAKHRKIINPAFHQEKLKVVLNFDFLFRTFNIQMFKI